MLKREHEWTGVREAEEEGKNRKPQAYSVLSTEPDAGLKLTTFRS